MKKNISYYIVIGFLFAVSSSQVFSQTPNSWTQKNDFGGTSSFGAVGINIGTKGYIGADYSKSFWEYDPATDTWTQKADFGGSARAYATGFSINNKGYVACGNDGVRKNDIWEYDPNTNIWTQKADFPGLPREGAVSFSIGSKGYLGTGLTSTLPTLRTNDFWEYDPTTDIWTQKSNFGGLPIAFGVGFHIGSKGYLGTGNNGTLQKEFWEYDPASDTWTRKADLGGAGRFQAVGLAAGGSGYIGLGDIGGSYTNDFWEYDPIMDTWTQRTSFGGHVRTLSTGFGIADKAYIGTGYDALNSVKYKDFWEFTPCSLPLISLEPTDKSIVYGDVALVHVEATDASLFQWQEDSGSGFTNITNGGIYSGATTSDLKISVPTVAMTGFKYRCEITGFCQENITTNGNATLTVSLKPLKITAADKSKCYDGLIFEGEYMVTYGGFVNSEDQSVLGGNLAFGGQIAAAPTSPGNYSIEPSGLTSSNYGITYVNGTLIIKPTPDAAIITRSGFTLISSAASGNQWYKDGLEIIGSTGNQYLVTVDGEYYTVVSEIGCNSAPSNSILVLNSSTKAEVPSLFDVYPNPSDGVIFIKVKTASTDPINIEIYNSLGVLILKQNNVNLGTNNVLKVDLQDKEAGLYTVLLRNKSKIYVKNVLISK